MFDTRQRTPVFAAAANQELLSAVDYAHVSGQPMLFVGASKSEQITVWDVSALFLSINFAE